MSAKKRVLVCGASGFIGRNIFERLANRNDIDLIGAVYTNRFSNDKRLLCVDLTEKHKVNQLLKGIDAVIMAAAVTSGSKDIRERPYIHVTDNNIMNQLLCRAAFDNNVGQLIYFGCSVNYSSSDTPVRETDINLNGSMDPAYFGVGWMKIYTEKTCEFFSRLNRTRFTVIRHSNIYGPHDKYDLEHSHMFGATITKVLTAKDGDFLTVWGNGQEKRDLLYVTDLVDFVELVLDKQDYVFDSFNVGYGSSVSVNDLVLKIIITSGKRLSVKHDLSKPTIPVNITLDINKAKEKFGWQPQVSLDEGIAKTIDWYRKNIQERII